MNSSIESDLLEIIDKYIDCYNRQDLLGVLKLFQRNSLAYQPTQKLLLNLFEKYRIKILLISKLYIGNDDEYAYVKLVSEVQKLDGPDFKNNISESLIIFEHSQGHWKILSQAILKIKYT